MRAEVCSGTFTNFQERRRCCSLSPREKNENVCIENKPDVVLLDLQEIGLSSGFYDNSDAR